MQSKRLGKKRKSLSAAWLVLVLFNLSCMTLPDVPWCTELSANDGVCFYWLTGKRVAVDNNKKRLEGLTWSKVRAQAVMCPATQCFVPLKKYQENMCHQSKKKCPNGAGSWGETIGGK